MISERPDIRISDKTSVSLYQLDNKAAIELQTKSFTFNQTHQLGYVHITKEEAFKLAYALMSLASEL